jgi:hypothetical protein
MHLGIIVSRQGKSRSMRRVIILGLAFLLAGARAPYATANELTEWMLAQSSSDFSADRDREDYEADDFPDPGADMRLRMSSVADRGLDDSTERALAPCGMDRSEKRRFFCWSSYGRHLYMALPTAAANVIGLVMPHTLYSYKAIDFRFPPSIRVHLPFNATSTFGYEDETLGMRLQLKF